MDYVAKQPIAIVKRLLIASLKKREETKAWDIWLMLYPYMTVPQPGAKQPSLKFMPFSRFYKEQTNPQQNGLTPEQIIAKFEEVKKKHQARA